MENLFRIFNIEFTQTNTSQQRDEQIVAKKQSLKMQIHEE